MEKQIGTRKYELQKTMLQAERDRDAGYAAAATRLEEVRTSFAVERGRLASIEAEEAELVLQWLSLLLELRGFFLRWRYRECSPA